MTLIKTEPFENLSVEVAVGLLVRVVDELSELVKRISEPKFAEQGPRYARRWNR